MGVILLVWMSDVIKQAIRLKMENHFFKGNASFLNKLLIFLRVPIELFHGTGLYQYVCLLASS